jgi:serine/threonine protein kinase
MALHDRFLLCSDGVHGFLPEPVIAEILNERRAPSDTSRALVEAALDAGGTDNATAMVLDVVRLPTRETAEFDTAIMGLPLIPIPIIGESVDGILLKGLLSDGRYSRLFAATDEIEGGDVAIKFPKPQAASEATYRTSYVREALVGELVNSPGLGRVIELPPGRQTCLYTVMPLYGGELLETRLARSPAIGLEEGRNIAIKLARAAAAVHRVGIIHRDIKPDNVILESTGSLKLIDLGVVRIPGMEDFPPENIPGTVAYMAPEMFAGEAGNVATDIYALGVTIFRALTNVFPYGNIDATGPARTERPAELTLLRPDLPAWLQATLNKAIARNPAARFHDMSEFAVELEAGPASAPLPPRRPQTLYERAPLRFWQAATGILALALAWALFFRH